MKGVILLVVGLLLLLAAGGGGYYAYTKYIAPPPEDAEAAKAKAKPAPAPVYVRVPPLQVPVVGADRVEQLITIVIVLQVRDQTAAGEVSSRMPRVFDTFLTSLYGAIDEGHLLKGSIVDISRVKKKLLEVSAQLLGKDTVKEVMVQTVLQRRL